MEFVEYVLGLEACNVNCVNSKGCTSLYIAARDGLDSVVKLLLACAGADVNRPENMGWTPVAAAAIGGHLACVEQLVNAHCNVDTLNNNHRSPVYHAATEGHSAVLERLIVAGADINARSIKGFSPVAACAKRGEKACLLLLLKYGADITLTNNEGWTAAHSAVSAGKKSCLEVLIDHGADVQALRDDGMAPAFLAAATGKVECLALLTSERGGVDPESCDAHGRSLAFFAATSKIGDACLECLFAQGVSVEQRVEPKCLKGHPLMEPTSKNKHRICELCRKSYTQKSTCLQCVTCQYDWCTACAGDRHAGWTLAHAAATGGSSKCLAYLIVVGAPITEPDHMGNTPLFTAAQSDALASACFIMLLNSGLSLLHTNKVYKRPLDVATTETLGGILEEMSELDLPESLWTSGQYYLWFFILQLSDEFKACAKIVTRCLTKFSDKLITARNAHGHQAIAVASKTNRALMQEYAYFCGRFDLDHGPAVHCSATSMVLLATDYGLGALYERCYKAVATPAPPTGEATSKTEVGPEPMLMLTRAAFATAIIQVGTASGLTHLWQRRQERYVSATVEDAGEISAMWTDSEFDEWSRSLAGDDAFTDTGAGAGSMPQQAFVDFCESLFGRSRRVAVKFMAHKDQYEREVGVRRGGQLNPRFVVDIVADAPDQTVISRAIAKLNTNTNTDSRLHLAAEYKFAIIMSAADRSLDAIFRQERPGTMQVALLMKEAALAVQHLHERDIVHGDLKMLNILRVEGRMVLVDMDAAAAVGEFACGKFSSGVLPPECFYTLRNEEEMDAYLEYWRGERESGSEMWQKVRPVEIPAVGFKARGKRRSVVVKTFRPLSATDAGPSTGGGEGSRPEPGPGLMLTDAKANAALPYADALVHASPSLDIWSFGAMLFALCAGKPLLPCNRDEDLSERAGVLNAASWTDEGLLTALHEGITDSSFALAADLLSRIFRVDPSQRPQSMSELLRHPFLSGSGSGSAGLADFQLKLDCIIENQSRQERLLECIDARTTVIDHCTQDTYARLIETEKVLLRGIFEASEVSTPTCFIILNQKLPIPPEEAEEKEEEEGETTAVGAAQRWMDKLTAMAGAVLEAIENPGSLARSLVLDELLTEENLYFYLVDEVSMQPVVCAEGSVYPIEIKKFHQTALLESLLPLMQVSLKAVALVNNAAGLARCLGFPLPCISDAVLEQGENWAESLGQSSSVEDYDVLQGVVESRDGPPTKDDEAENAAQAVRGGPLRELRRFLAEQDQENSFANLSRVCTRTGTACWTLPGNVETLVGESREVSSRTGSPTRPPRRPPAKPASIPAPAPEVELEAEAEAETTVVVAVEAKGAPDILSCMEEEVAVSISQPQPSSTHEDTTGAPDAGSATVPATSSSLAVQQAKDEIIQALREQLGELQTSVATVVRNQEMLSDHAQTYARKSEEHRPPMSFLAWLASLWGPKNEKIAPMGP